MTNLGEPYVNLSAGWYQIVGGNTARVYNFDVARLSVPA
jgi:hypothetical protein